MGKVEFKLKLASISYGHPLSIPLGYSLNLTVTSQDGGPGARVAVELDAAFARKLVEAIQEVIRREGL